MALDEFLTDLDATELRDISDSRLIHRAVIISVGKARPPGDNLGWVPVETRLKSDVPCFVRFASGAMKLVGAQDVALSNATVIFANGENVQPKHRLYVTGSNGDVEFAVRLGVLEINRPHGFAVNLTTKCTDAVGEAGEGPPPA